MKDIVTMFFEQHSEPLKTQMPLQDYLLGCRDNPVIYPSVAERMLTAIGHEELVDTIKGSRLSLIFQNQTVKYYEAFKNFYGMEDTIERTVGCFRYAAQGLEERKKNLYLSGPVGGGKSSLAERLTRLVEEQLIYVLKAGDQISPVFESPLGLFDPIRMAGALTDKYGIPRRRLPGLMSPWALRRLDKFDGNISKFCVVKIYSSRLPPIGVAKVEPGDENNQDISTLVGKVDIRQLEHYSQDHPDSYSFSGGLNRTIQGVLEFVEMFKAPIKMLHPLLTAPQEGNYIGTESFGAIPFQGIILAHSNESKWQKFKNNKITKLSLAE